MERAFGKLKHNEKQPELPTRRLRHEALAALHIAISAADPKRIVRANLKLRKSRLRVGSIAIDLNSFDRVFVIGGGKASAAMGEELERILGTRISGGVINYPDYLRPRPRSRLIFYNEATHPVPSVKGVRGVEKMLNLLGKPTRKDLVFCLISGGGSALLPRPVKGVTLSDKQKTTELLLESGASISEINCVRKHLSSIKGGRLAELLYPARVISLIISDVVGDRLDSIASGPTAPDSTTYQDAKQVLSKYRLFEQVPSRVRRIIREGLAGRSPETPKPGSKIFRRVSNLIVGSNEVSCLQAYKYLKSRGYNSAIISTRVQGQAKTVGQILAGIMIDSKKHGFPLRPPAAIVAGGETTVEVRGKGKGGRNQELVLSAAIEIAGLERSVVSSIGTDGIDGPTDAAGAIADGATVDRARRLHVDPKFYLERNDSYSFFKKLSDLIITGPTGTNVNDIMVAVLGK